MDTNNNIKNSPIQTPVFDVSKLAAAAQVLKSESDKGFFNTTSNKEKIENYFNLLKEYASMPGVSQKAVEATFKSVTGLDYNIMMNNQNTTTHKIAVAA